MGRRGAEDRAKGERVRGGGCQSGGGGEAVWTEAAAEVDAARDPLDEKRFTVVYYTVDGPAPPRQREKAQAALASWAAEPEVWRFELLCGHGCVPKNPDRPGGRPTFSFSKGSMRSRGM